MECKKTLYTFEVVKNRNGELFEYMGDVLTEISAFGNSEESAIKIIVKEFGEDLTKRLSLKFKKEMSLYGKLFSREATPKPQLEFD